MIGQFCEWKTAQTDFLESTTVTGLSKKQATPFPHQMNLGRSFKTNSLYRNEGSSGSMFMWGCHRFGGVRRSICAATAEKFPGSALGHGTIAEMPTRVQPSSDQSEVWICCSLEPYKDFSFLIGAHTHTDTQTPTFEGAYEQMQLHEDTCTQWLGSLNAMAVAQKISLLEWTGGGGFFCRKGLFVCL